MAVFSYEFFIMWILTVILFYTVARKWQWQLLLIVSCLFYARSVTGVPWILFLVWGITYFAGIYVSRHKNISGKTVCYAAVMICAAALMLGRLTSVFVLLGNSYFTLKAIGYVIDVYRGKAPEKNLFRYLLYLIYWPTVLEGPFNRIEGFFRAFASPVSFDYTGFTHGVQRFVWGAFQVIVISKRLGVIAAAILTAPYAKGGRYVVIAVAAFALQLYADFSGFMNMMSGVSATFGISLPENFEQPFFSKSIPEFWRRWHITLGVWFRDYVMFPFSSGKGIKKISRNIRKRNKALGKLFPVLSGTCLVWILTGVWHGFSVNYLLWGCYYAVLMCLSQIMSALSEGRGRAGDRKGKLDFNLLRILRTVFLVLTADTLICVDGLSNVGQLWHEILFHFNGGDSYPFIIAGLTSRNLAVLALCLLLLFAVSVMKEKKISVQTVLDRAPTAIRWAVYYGLVYGILIFGLYDTQYDVSQFMYMQF